VDEVVAISKVVSFLRAPEYARFSRIVFDTAPTGHTLRLLTLPDFLDATIGKVCQLHHCYACFVVVMVSSLHYRVAFTMSPEPPAACLAVPAARQTLLNALQVVRLRAKLTDAAGAVKGMFGIKSEKDPAVAKLEALQVRSLGLGSIRWYWCLGLSTQSPHLKAAVLILLLPMYMSRTWVSVAQSERCTAGQRGVAGCRSAWRRRGPCSGTQTPPNS
jgi:anion-transporting  ArsA/GET3 family ATPase